MHNLVFGNSFPNDKMQIIYNVNVFDLLAQNNVLPAPKQVVLLAVNNKDNSSLSCLILNLLK